MKKYSIVFLLLLIVLTVFVGCGPTKKQLAERQRLEEERVVRQMKLKEQAAARVARRIAAGEVQPNKPNDPGYEICCCLQPKPGDDVVSMHIPRMSHSGANNIICGNTKAGKEILKWRKWYCKGQPASCIYAEWKEGQPTFGETLQYPTLIKLPLDGGGIGIIEYTPACLEMLE